MQVPAAALSHRESLNVSSCARLDISGLEELSEVRTFIPELHHPSNFCLVIFLRVNAAQKA